MGKKRKVLVAQYIFFILWITLFSRRPGTVRIFTCLFWEVKNHVWVDVLINILLFIPLGVLLGILTESWKAVIYGFLLSVFIEFAQYVFILGYCQMDDVLNNTIGTVVGFGIWNLLSVLMKKRCE